LYGPDGVRWVGLLIANARGDTKYFDAKFPAWGARCIRMAAKAPAEIIFGGAGYVNAARVLYEHTKRDDVGGVLDRAAHALLEVRATTRWDVMDNIGFAHGRTGVFHALLAWSGVRGQKLPLWLHHSLHKFGAMFTKHGLARVLAPMGNLAQTWCNGSAGLALLWAKAFEQTHDLEYLRYARDTARFGVTRVKDDYGGNVCCGLAGRSAACLALARVDPRRGWYDDALSLATEATTQMSGPWPYGFEKGYGGVTALGVDLLEINLDLG
jgi:hypothetical protein